LAVLRTVQPLKVSITAISKHKGSISWLKNPGTPGVTWSAHFMGNVAGGVHRIAVVSESDIISRRLVTVPVAGPLGLDSPLDISAYKISPTSMGFRESEIKISTELTACHEATGVENGVLVACKFINSYL
jgi:hypothetical protein